MTRGALKLLQSSPSFLSGRRSTVPILATTILFSLKHLIGVLHPHRRNIFAQEATRRREQN